MKRREFPLYTSPGYPETYGDLIDWSIARVNGPDEKILFRMSDANKSTLITVTHDHELLSGFDGIIDFADFQKNTRE